MKKKTFKAGLVAAVALTGALAACTNGASTDANGNPIPTTADSLRVALANQDSLLILMNEISDGMAQIRSVEQILTVSNINGESPSRKEELKNDMLAIKQALEERRNRLEELEKKLKSSAYNNETLKKSIETLKAQIAEQENVIASLKDDLARANIRIGELKGSVDSLNSTVAEVSTQRDMAEKENLTLVNEMNTVHYLVGTSKELKSVGVLKGGGFLRSAKINTAEFDVSKFTAADRRNFTTLPLYSSKVKVLTPQPADSYTITGDKEKVLTITNPDKFWKTSDFLVIQVD